MTVADFQELLRLARERDEKHYAFVKQLLLGASGALTLLVSLKASTAMAPAALWSIRTAWVALGLGILLLTVALRGDTWTQAELVRLMAEQLRRPPSERAPIVATRPALFAWSERIAYGCLATTVVALVWHAIAMTS